MANDSNNNALAIAIFNFIYLLLSVILLAPKTYLSEGGSSFLPAYGAASAVYCLGIIYSFFQELLSPNDNSGTVMQRIINILKLLLAVLNITCVALYYFVFPELLILVNIGYICILLTVLLSLFLAVLPVLIYINDGNH